MSTVVKDHHIIDQFKGALQNSAPKIKDQEFQALVKESANAFLEKGIPKIKEEDWKYCNIGIALDHLIDPPSDSLPSRVKSEPPEVQGDFIQMLDGEVVKASLSSELKICRFQEASAAEKTRFLHTIKRQLPLETNAFALLNYALLSDVYFLVAQKSGSYHVQIISEQSSTTFRAPSLYILAESNSQLSISLYDQCENLKGFVSSLVVIDANRDATVELNVIADTFGDGVTLRQWRIFQESGSAVRYHAYAPAAGTSRTDMLVDFFGEGCDFVSHQLSFNTKENQQHFFTRVQHLKPHCTSDQLFKNVLLDKSRISTDSTVFVDRGAALTESKQMIHNLFLSEQAKASNKPNLTILNDDVKCNHGATSGTLNPQSLFYLGSRGISEEDARGLIVLSFTDEVLETLKNTEFANWVRRRISDELILKKGV